MELRCLGKAVRKRSGFDSHWGLHDLERKVNMLVYKTGDVLNSGEKFIVHGCNCFNTMGSGIAAQIRKQYPFAYDVDQLTEQGNYFKLGTYSQGTEGDVTIINAYTQYKFGRDKRYAEYDAIEMVMNGICYDFQKVDIMAMPKIGCGLAGGDWNIVADILDRVSARWKKTFHVYTLEGNSNVQ